MKPLEGHVEFRLDLTSSKLRKKQRTNLASHKAEEDANANNVMPEAGFYLVINSGRERDSFLLSVPHQMRKLVCDAARFQAKLKLSRYTMVPLLFGSSGKRKRSYCEMETPKVSQLLEIHHGGMEIDLKFIDELKKSQEEEYLALKQLHDEEITNRQDCSNAKSAEADIGGKRKKCSRRYSLRGRVDSISPILDISEPFALMEMYDNEAETPFNCVVVFHGNSSLSCHHGIFPGDSISLRQVKRKSWNMQKDMLRRNLPHLANRLPSHIFQVTDASTVVWDSKTRDSVIPPLPSTPIPLVSLQGQVVSLKLASHDSADMHGKSSRIIHSVDLELLLCHQPTVPSKQQRHILYLVYYPMTPSLSLGIRRGAVIQAVNIHCIGSSSDTIYYGACLRSTISILQMPPGLEASATKNRTNPAALQQVQNNPGLTGIESDRESPANVDGLYFPSRPLYLRSIERSYMEYACHREFERWYRDKNDFVGLKLFQGKSLPSCSRVVAMWWKHHCGGDVQEQRSRHAYVEYFDHAHGGVEDPTTQQGGCPCSQPLEGGQHLPRWFTLNELRDHGLLALRKRLANTIVQLAQSKGRDGLRKLQIGWTGSIHMTPSELLERLHDEDHCSINPVLYTGGAVIEGCAVQGGCANETQSADQCLQWASLANSICILPGTALPAADAPGCKSFGIAKESFQTNAGLAFGRLDGLVASSICIGVSSETDFTTPKIIPRDANNNNFEENQDSEGMKEELGSRVAGEDVLHFPLHDCSTTGSNDNTTVSTGQTPHGACCLFHFKGMVFVLSVQLRFRSLVNIFPSRPIQKPSKLSDGLSEAKEDPQACTVQQCLDPESPTPCGDADQIVGLLARQKFRLSRMKKNDSRYRGLVLTICHMPICQAGSTRELGQELLSTLQTLEVKTGIPYTTLASKMAFLRDVISKLSPKTPINLDDAINISLAWWYVTDKPNICALAAGGWDELLPCSSLLCPEAGRATSIAVSLTGPIDESDPRGFKRFAYPITSIYAYFLPLRQPAPSVSLPSSDARKASVGAFAGLDFLGGLKFLPGELDRRPLRRIRRGGGLIGNESHVGSQVFPVPKGELMALPTQFWTGIPDCSLADMLRYVCFDLGNKQNSCKARHGPSSKTINMSPSLVRRLKGARLLGISFCKVQLTCSTCFKPLYRDNRQAKLTRKGGRKGWGNEGKQPASFWNCPLPMFASMENEAAKKPVIWQLNCPKGCYVDGNAEVKWECSGTVDDGTGQAMLHAEREAAVMLLGLDRSAINAIAAGAYRTTTCSITFNKKVPPLSHLARAVEAANFKYAAQEKERNRRRKSQRSSLDKKTETQQVLEMLDPPDRARYLLCQHCRYSEATTRPLDYLIRCKPLSDTAVHLRHTEVDIFAPGLRATSSQGVASYSLPPLKLNLVDCCYPTAGSGGVVEETFDLLLQAMDTPQRDK